MSAVCCHRCARPISLDSTARRQLAATVPVLCPRCADWHTYAARRSGKLHRARRYRQMREALHAAA